MSLVKIQGNPSGTGAFTIAAPNSNTDRTLTLPDATGTVNVSGLVNEVPAGSVTVPSLYSTGDTNTGIFFPAADTVAVTTGGSERMRVGSTGNVLIGTATSVSNNRLVIDQASGDGANSGFLIQRNGAAGTSLKIDIDSSDVANFRRGVTNAMSITSSGNVGIGTLAPTFNLHVNDSIGNATIAISAEDASNSILYMGDQTSATVAYIQYSHASNFMNFRVNSIDRVKIDSSGAVTIANLAGTGSRAVNASATGVLSAASDSRLKEEVPEASIPSLAEVMLLKPRAYKWLDDIEKRGEDAAVEIGFFADEVKDIIPSAAPMGNDGYYGFYDRSVIAALTRAIQEQQTLIQEQQTLIQELTARVATLEAN